MNEQKECPLCGKLVRFQDDCKRDLVFYSCSVCGRYQIGVFDGDYFDLDENKAASYMFYKRFLPDSFPIEYRYHTFLTKEECDKYNQSFEEGYNIAGRPVHVDNELIGVWYPKTFSERVDYIIKYLGTHIEHIGQQIAFSYPEMLGLLFIDRKELIETYAKREWTQRDKDACKSEAKYMLDSISDSGLIEYSFGDDEEKAIFIRLTPKGYARVDELQKNNTNGKNAFVAMKFGDETRSLREAIRKGIEDAGYCAVFIDEVPHNNFITPELLKHIRDSKFVVADLTHENNGAYFEEGYAMGLDKPVIQLCKQDTKLHFDIAQKNTIMWKTEDDIPEKLCNRIKATID